MDKEHEDYSTYGKEGTIVDELTYQKECESLVCRELDGEKYGKDGTIVDDKTYQLECGQRYFCKKENGFYFDNEGNIVDQETYEALCEKSVDNPQTGSSLPIYILLVLIASIIGIFYYTKKQKRFL